MRRAFTFAVLFGAGFGAILGPSAAAPNSQEEKKAEPITKAEQIFDGLPATARPKPDASGILGPDATIDLVEARGWLRKNLIGKKIQWATKVVAVHVFDADTGVSLQTEFDMKKIADWLPEARYPRYQFGELTIDGRRHVVLLRCGDQRWPSYWGSPPVARKVLALKDQAVTCVAQINTANFSWRTDGQEYDAQTKPVGAAFSAFILTLGITQPTLNGWDPLK